VAEGRHNTRQLAIKAFADGDFLLRAAQVKPSSADARVLSRKAPTSIFAIDKASVAFASCGALPHGAGRWGQTRWDGCAGACA
jgi:hypothetical protein